MNKYQSKAYCGEKVNFPKFDAEKIYMLPFQKKRGLPSNLKHWQETVDQMLSGIESAGVIYLMIDQAFVKANDFHRRKGLHIDGYWCGPNTGHTGHRGSRYDTQMSWVNASFQESEALVLASNISAACGYVGEFEGVIGDKGSCEHLDTSHLEQITLDANRAYIGNVTFLHESLPVPQDCFRTVVRLNVPGFCF